MTNETEESYIPLFLKKHARTHALPNKIRVLKKDGTVIVVVIYTCELLELFKSAFVETVTKLLFPRHLQSVKDDVLFSGKETSKRVHSCTRIYMT